MTPEEWPTCFIRLQKVDVAVKPALPLLCSSVLFCVQHEAALHRPTPSQRIALASSLLNGVDSQNLGACVVVANSFYGQSVNFLAAVRQIDLAFACEVSPSQKVESAQTPRAGKSPRVKDQLEGAQWISHCLEHPFTHKTMWFDVADLGQVKMTGQQGKLLVAQFTNIEGEDARRHFIFTSELNSPFADIINAALWSRWIKPFIRAQRKVAGRLDGVEPMATQAQPLISAQARCENTVRSNSIHPHLAEVLPTQITERRTNATLLHGALSQASPVLNTAELFSGAGGMGLGFLMARAPHARFRIVFSAEVNPIYARTLAWNHEKLPLPNGERRCDWVPHTTSALDLRRSATLDAAVEQTRAAGGLHVLIGGPPCQGFSSSNRNSGYSGNPNNRLVEVFLEYVERLRPRVFLMENVQGILWTPTGNDLQAPMVVEHLQQRMEQMGYLVFPKLLDAAWYGVPQHRNRFFLIGIHRDLGYRKDSFGEDGPFPRPTHGHGTPTPYVTVSEALTDLPAVGNGHFKAEIPYDFTDHRSPFAHLMRANSKADVVWDHVTSRHADYVLERYRAVPQGGNWEDIKHMMNNYASHDGTHSNIYRRLRSDEPSITIGHYRKAMLIHPSQHRGLSLREAARLQSFPDWFRFAGSAQDVVRYNARSGLSHQQQQLANAVCPLMLQAIGDYLLRL